jgi:DNA processing protein
MSGKLNSDSLAILLLGTNLAIPYKAEHAPKPLTPKEWEDLSLHLRGAGLRPQFFLEKSSAEWRQQLDLSAQEIERIEQLLSNSGLLSIELERLSNSGIWVTTRAEEHYPTRWKKLLGQKSPIVVYGAGDPSMLRPREEGVAIVGSRNTDEAGANFATQLGTRCAQEGLIVVSGGARGVDQLAQSSALYAGGKVVSILSEGLEPNMKKKDLRNGVLSGNLLVLSAVHPRTRFTAYNAMARNKYVYTFAHYGVVVASDADKGGTWSGAVENLENGWVPTLVRKGAVMPKGNTRLLELGASPIMENFGEITDISLRDLLRKAKAGCQQVALSHERNQAGVDLFEIVWPYIESELMDPKNETELANSLHIQTSQMLDWLEKAQQIGRVEKRGNGYIASRPETSRNDSEKMIKMKQPSLFDADR